MNRTGGPKRNSARRLAAAALRRSQTPIAGFVDGADFGAVHGWVASGGAEAVVVRTDHFVQRLDAHVPRPDLPVEYPEAGGFRLEVPAALDERIRRSGAVRYEVSDAAGRPLLHSPASVFDDSHHPANQLSIFAVLFFDAQGKEFLHGGAERYVLDLAEVAAQFGLRTVVYQASNAGHWRQFYESVEVRGVPWDFSDLRTLSSALADAAPPAVLNVYSPFVLAVRSVRRPAVGISHGVFWDIAGNQFKDGSNEEQILSGLLHCDSVVSVDTNTINFIRGIQRGLADRITYIPNYVDDSFFVNEGRLGRFERVVIGFPRRLYDPRGLGLLEAVIPRVIDEFDDVDFSLVGGISADDRPRLDHLLESFPDRVTWRRLPPEQMANIYQTFDIALIPTVNSEGTSLSALEAMASSNAVIATHVGGLTDLILDGYNGYLIAPEPDALFDAIQELVLDRIRLASIAARGRDVARAFAKPVWSSRWTRLIETCAPSTGSRPSAQPTLVHPRTPGITWSKMVQRPQHVCSAAARLGMRVLFISDAVEGEQAHRAAEQAGVTLLDPEAEVHLESALVYFYYAYSAVGLLERRDGNHATFESSEGYASDAASPELQFTGLHIKKMHLWFDVLDHPVIHGDDPEYERLFRTCLKEAAVVSASSDPLAELTSGLREDVQLIRNGVWPDDFSRAQRPYADLDMADATRLATLFASASVFEYDRRVLFYGALADWVDLDDLDEVASDKNTALILAGPITDSVKQRVQRLTQRPNVFYLGTVDYPDLSLLLSVATTGIVPFSRHNPDLVDAVLPLKFLEFLAAGIDILTTPLTAITAVMATAPAAVQARVHWLRPGAIAAHLAGPPPAKQELPVEFADAISWTTVLRSGLEGWLPPSACDVTGPDAVRRDAGRVEFRLDMPGGGSAEVDIYGAPFALRVRSSGHAFGADPVVTAIGTGGRSRWRLLELMERDETSTLEPGHYRLSLECPPTSGGYVEFELGPTDASGAMGP